MAKNGYQEGKGLGSQLQGDKRPVTLPEKFDRLGLGYEKLVEGKFQAVTFKRKDKKSEVQRIPHLRETFPAPAEVIMSEEAAPPRYRLTINTLDEEVLKEYDVIRPSLNQELLKNWESKPIIDVVASKNLGLIEMSPHERNFESLSIDSPVTFDENDCGPDENEEDVQEFKKNIGPSRKVWVE
ncbi:G-patch domain [Sesbania bispinosa]|nr:G-patch domain [Sesbania bispinosa]